MRFQCLHESNKQVKLKLKEVSEINDFVDVPIRIYAKLNKQELYDFIKVRQFVGSYANREESYKMHKNKKGKIANAERGAMKLISAAYDTYESHVMLILINKDEMLVHDTEKVVVMGNVVPTSVEVPADQRDFTANTYLSNLERINNIKKYFKGTYITKMASVSEDQKNKQIC